MAAPLSLSSDQAALTSFFFASEQQNREDDAQLRSFFEDFARDYQAAKITRAKDTPHFNVLKVFGLQYRELRHSDALAWFLDAEAEHEQGALFTNSFLKLIGLGPTPDERYQVDRERHERTDLALYKPSHFAVFIENKAFHDEVDSSELLLNQIVPLRRLDVFRACL